MNLLHATCVDVAGAGVLILGAPGQGKSDLAMRLIAEGALLVSDDQTALEVVEGRLLASPAPNILGLLEARGCGILRAATKSGSHVRLVVQLTDDGIDRMPDPAHWVLPGTESPRMALLRLRAFEASATAKLRLVLHSVPNP